LKVSPRPNNEPPPRKRAPPSCRVCAQPVVAGQRDRRGRAVHYSCQITGLRPARRRPGLPPRDEATPTRAC